MSASISKRLFFVRVRDSIVFSLGMLTALSCTLQANSGEQYNHNNIAYSLLSEVIGSVTGTPYDDFVEHKLPQPIGLNYIRNNDLLMHTGDTQAEGLAIQKGS